LLPFANSKKEDREEQHNTSDLKDPLGCGWQWRRQLGCGGGGSARGGAAVAAVAWLWRR